MVFTIKIDCDNAAFEECTGVEVARIIRDAAERIDGRPLCEGNSQPLRDVNGNTVGHFDVWETADINGASIANAR